MIDGMNGEVRIVDRASKETLGRYRRPPRKHLHVGGQYRAARAEISPDRHAELGAKRGGFVVGRSLRQPIHVYISPVISHADLGFTAVRWLVPTAR